MIIHEPTRGKDGRLRSVVEYEDGSKAWKSYPKLLLEQKIGRQLTTDETCDHIDDDFNNNDPNNLQVLTRAQNAAKGMLLRPAEWYHFICPTCKKQASKRMNQVQHNWNLGKSGPVCSKQCAGLAGKGLTRHETTYDYDPVTEKVTVQSKSWEIA